MRDAESRIASARTLGTTALVLSPIIPPVGMALGHVALSSCGRAGKAGVVVPKAPRRIALAATLVGWFGTLALAVGAMGYLAYDASEAHRGLIAGERADLAAAQEQNAQQYGDIPVTDTDPSTEPVAQADPKLCAAVNTFLNVDPNDGAYLGQAAAALAEAPGEHSEAYRSLSTLIVELRETNPEALKKLSEDRLRLNEDAPRALREVGEALRTDAVSCAPSIDLSRWLAE